MKKSVRKATIAVPAAALVSPDRCRGRACRDLRVAAPSARRTKNNRPVSNAHFQHYKLKGWG